VNGALAVLGQRLYLLPDAGDQRAFIGLQYDLYDRIPGGPPPRLHEAESLPADAGTDGELVAVGDCDALYRSDGTDWRAVELRPGGRFRQTLTGRLVPGPVAAGDRWSVELIEAGDGRVAARYRSDDGTTITGEGIDPPPGEVVLDVVADPALPDVRVTLDDGDRELVSAFLVPAGGPVIRSEGWDARTGGAPLCERLVRRLGQRGSSTTMN